MYVDDCDHAATSLRIVKRRISYALKASLMLMKRYKAGSQIKPASWQAFTHDSPCSEAKSCRAPSGGQDAWEVMLEAHVRTLELGRSMKGASGLPCHILEAFTGGKRASGEQKSCRCR